MTKNPSTIVSPAKGLFFAIRSVENSGSKYPSLNRSRINVAFCATVRLETCSNLTQCLLTIGGWHLRRPVHDRGRDWPRSPELLCPRSSFEAPDKDASHPGCPWSN